MAAGTIAGEEAVAPTLFDESTTTVFFAALAAPAVASAAGSAAATRFSARLDDVPFGGATVAAITRAGGGAVGAAEATGAVACTRVESAAGVVT